APLFLDGRMLGGELTHHVEETGARLRPRRLVRVAVGVLLQAGLQLRIVQDRVDRVGDLVGGLEVDEDAPVVGERLYRVQVRRGDDGFPRAERVRERPAGYLVRVEVRRDVDVGGEQVVDDVLLFEVLVHEDHVVGQSQLLDEGGQTDNVVFVNQ